MELSSSIPEQDIQDTSGPIPRPAQQPAHGSRLDRFALAGELVVAVAHDLRQPLAAIEMNIAAGLQLLRRPAPALEAAIGALEAALDEERRIRDSVRVLQELATKRAPCREACDLAVALRQALALVRTEASAHGVSIQIEAPSTLPLVFGDLTLIRQAFVSLLLESIEPTMLARLDDAAIRVTVRRVDDVIEVEAVHPGRVVDDGMGDWQLALVRSVVEEHEGQMEVAVADGKTRVATRWPLHAR